MIARTSPRAQSFIDFFRTATRDQTPYDWQLQVALAGLPDLLTVPTGLGKTEAALAWAWRLLIDQQDEPLHLGEAPQWQAVLPGRGNFPTSARLAKTIPPGPALRNRRVTRDGGEISEQRHQALRKAWYLPGGQPSRQGAYRAPFDRA